MQGYATSAPPTNPKKMMMGQDSRSLPGIYARGSARQTGQNQNISPEAIRRRLEKMQGVQ
jgi:hypothetical protein